MFELSGLFICLEGLVKFFSTFWDRKYCWVVVFKVGGLVPSLKLCIYFLVNVSYIVCKSTLFEMTFEIHFYQKTLHTFKNICWNTFIVHQGHLWTGSCFQVLQISLTYFPHDHQMRPSEKSYAVATFIANSLVWFFNLMISEYVLKIAATFVTSSKAV